MIHGDFIQFFHQLSISPCLANIPRTSLITTFSVNDAQWITPRLRLDNNASNNIYPSCDNSSAPTQYIPTGAIKVCVNSKDCDVYLDSGEDCASRACKSDFGLEGSNRTAIYPHNFGVRDNAFAMTLTLTNHPILGQSFLTVSGTSWNGWTQGCGYGQAFDTNSGLQIYLALLGPSQSMTFNAFQIQYSYDTESPTPAPTNSPIAPATSNPSILPSYPTQSPTIAPLQAPIASIMPTTSPTVTMGIAHQVQLPRHALIQIHPVRRYNMHGIAFMALIIASNKDMMEMYLISVKEFGIFHII